MILSKIRLRIYATTLVFLAARIAAQTSDAQCLDSFDWILNSKGQTPCLVAAYLLSRCANNQWNVPALHDGEYYRGPNNTEINQCQCSTVTYQLMSGCGACQGQQITAWSTWRTSCSNSLVSIASFPKEIPPATSVPAWAFIDITGTDQFDVNTAQSIGDEPESTVGGSSSTYSPPPSTSSSPPSQSATLSPSNSTSTAPPVVTATKDKSDIPAIVGGSVGGGIGCLLIICGIVFLWRRDTLRYTTKKKSAPSAEFVTAAGKTGSPPLDPAAVGFRSRANSPLTNPLFHNPATGPSPPTSAGLPPSAVSSNAALVGSPWSPPPAVHTPAPNYGAYSGVYTPAPQNMNVAPNAQHVTAGFPYVHGYQPPNSGQSQAQGTTAYPSVPGYGHDRSASYSSRYNGAPEL